MEWKHVRLRDGRVTVCSTAFEVDADGVLSPTPEDPEVLRVLRRHPNYKPVQGAFSQAMEAARESTDAKPEADLDAMGFDDLKALAEELDVYESSMRSKKKLRAAIRAAREK